MAHAYTLNVITPYGSAFEGEIEMLVAPAQDGLIGIMAKHAPIVTALKAGILKIVYNQKEQFWTIASGVLEMNKENQCLILTDSAEPLKKTTA